jgi:hypothetical protein
MSDPAGDPSAPSATKQPRSSSDLVPSVTVGVDGGATIVTVAGRF